MQKLIEIMRRLRAKDGCPWDREQTLESMKHCLLEESYEVIDAIDSGDQAHHMEELGDVLGQIVFQSQIRKENGEFELDDVVAAVCDSIAVAAEEMDGSPDHRSPDHQRARPWRPPPR